MASPASSSNEVPMHALIVIRAGGICFFSDRGLKPGGLAGVETLALAVEVQGGRPSRVPVTWLGQPEETGMKSSQGRLLL